MITGKNIALTRWTFVAKVISLLFNMLFMFVITFLPRSKCLLISWLQSRLHSDPAGFIIMLKAFGPVILSASLSVNVLLKSLSMSFSVGITGANIAFLVNNLKFVTD